VIENLNDPLVHLIRNALDHGLETVDERIAAGKPPRGKINITASHQRGEILLQIKDDGRGIDADRLREKAVSNGLFSESESKSLSRAETIDLIFMPGLSTAQKVTDISGRGVGMDIVRTRIEALNGSITVETRPGVGTEFNIVLPLTLAIIPTLLIEVGSLIFAIPLSAVTETLRVETSQIRSVHQQATILTRGETLPLLELSTLLNLPTNNNSELRNVVSVQMGRARLGLVVDQFLGEGEVTVKPLGGLLGKTQGVSGAAILGTGQIALILDLASLVRLASSNIGSTQSKSLAEKKTHQPVGASATSS
jgi:two-component system chemotaxis sensor kinase CheA